jgi:glycosyltransferase involved in cell wall biosynthesis
VVRVTYLLSDLGGGTGHHLLDLLDSRSPADWEAKIVSEVPSTSRMKLPVEHLVLDPPRGPARYPIRQLLRYRQLEQLFRRDPPDVLHTFFFWSVLYGRLLKARGVVPRLVENREDMGFGMGIHEHAWYALTRRLPDRVICVSDAVRDTVLETEHLPASRLTVVRNGIRRSEPMPDPRLDDLRAELRIPPTSPVVLMVANYDRPVKGVVHFFDALPLIRRDLPEARFVLIGHGRREAEFRDRAKALGIDDVLLMPGFREDVHRFYELANVSVLTSLSEGLSITVLESMRHGVPVVVTEVGGNPEIVQQGRTGILVPPGDAGRFAEAVVRLLRDPALRDRFGREAERVIREEFDLGRVVERYGRIYEEVLRAD